MHTDGKKSEKKYQQRGESTYLAGLGDGESHVVVAAVSTGVVGANKCVDASLSVKLELRLVVKTAHGLRATGHLPGSTELQRGDRNQ